MADVVPIREQETAMFDLDAEGAVLSAILIDPNRHDELVALLTREMFYADANRNVFEAIETLRASNRAVDAVSVTQELRAMDRLAQVGGSQYLGTLLYATPAIANIVEHARIVREKWRLRRAREEAQRLASAIKTTNFRPDEVQRLLEDMESVFGELAHQHASSHLRSIRDVLAETYALLSSTAEGGAVMTGIPTLFRALDLATSGLHPGDLTIIAGRPGSGKSAFAMNIVENVATQGYGGAFFSLEMPASQLVTRVLSSNSGISLARFRAPTSLKTDWQKLVNAMAKIDPYPIWLDDTAGITVPEIAARVRKLKSDIKHNRVSPSANGLVVVAVDYVQLVSAQGKTVHNREQEVAQVSRELKLLAKREDIAVLGLSQLNRSGVKRASTDKRPQLEDLRESGALEQDADNVFFVHRPEMFSQDDPLVRGIAEIIIGKQRNGPPGIHRLAFSAETVRFRTLEPDDLDEYDGFQDDLGG